MEATLHVEKRESRGKNEARRLRASGRIPAVVYGTEKNTATAIAVDPKMLLRILHSESGVNQQGGIVDFVSREIEVECLPADIPEHIDLEIGELMLHQGIRVRDLPKD